MLTYGCIQAFPPFSMQWRLLVLLHRLQLAVSAEAPHTRAYAELSGRAEGVLACDEFAEKKEKKELEQKESAPLLETRAHAFRRLKVLSCLCQHTSAYVSIRQHT